ncbi:tRNA 2-selenouridine(34) synthase MnmH [Helicobacter cappadocius]|uniref:tRNA 2-selenouridine(34) synthase MnmH n=1 Tax=Helicobacter cappadocius TaxID=3063998 RepID=A0AA90PS51_9HELI|nr:MULTISPECIES: tRNA 2-selenouridine(34) synthase MnmH [unclassified Helicobacter]MDO7252602.1 tRNA 2-selenouridine(34) synthase MnmH [Helicobacter sp. faydin-H75]MDP2538469.1 tRNA 2-selenouridine(34) synthase MnmH [Helicobacter sp. faydin-H76]
MAILSNKNLFKEFDYIIDVRTPREYDYSHIPNSINLPVFSNEEHARIGTIYKQESPLKASILGASIACKNISALLDSISENEMLQAILNHKNKSIVYCARGGKRSEAMKTILGHIGFRVSKLENGYKAYRNEVLNYFNTPLKHRFISLCGPTGCGKSEIIEILEDSSIHLEKLARHYGSSFGGMATYYMGKQPSQKMFENILYEDIQNKQNQPILFIEAESRKLGNLIIPNSLFSGYHNGINILIQAPIEQRIGRIVKLYKNIPEADFFWAMEKIKPYIQKNIFAIIGKLWENQELEKIAEILIEKYYDKVYKIGKYSHIISNTNSVDTAKELLEFKEFYKDSFNPL